MNKTIAQVIKGYAKMVVANGDKEELREDHWLLVGNATVLADVVREIKETANWQNKLYKADVDTEDENEIEDYASELMQDAIDKLVK